ncbi:MAG: DUF2058 domain-containing protein [Pseudomonadales bacterium]
MSTLQDQLLKAGLVDDKKVKKVQKDKRKAAKVQRHSKEQVVDEARVNAEQARAEKVRRDSALNAELNAAAERKALTAQIKQLIKMNRQAKIEAGAEGDIAYNFTDGSKIKKMYVSEDIQRQLSRGRLAIVKLNEAYELVPAGVAEKIALRDASYIIAQNSRDNNQPREGDADDDPYAEFKIPDDLMW